MACSSSDSAAYSSDGAESDSDEENDQECTTDIECSSDEDSVPSPRARALFRPTQSGRARFGPLLNGARREPLHEIRQQTEQGIPGRRLGFVEECVPCASGLELLPTAPMNSKLVMAVDLLHEPELHATLCILLNT